MGVGRGAEKRADQAAREVAEKRYLGAALNASAVAADLRSALQVVIALEDAQSSDRDVAVQMTLKDADPELLAPPLNEVIREVHESVRASPDLYASQADKAERLVRHLRNAAHSWPVADDGADEALVKCKNADRHLHMAVLEAVRATLPDRVAQALREEKRAGTSLRITELTKDLLPDESDQAKALEWLQESPNRFREGMLNLAEKRVYKLPPESIKSRWTRYVAPVVFVAGSFGALFLLPWLIPDAKPPHPLDEGGPLRSAYALVLVGVAAHSLVDFWKRGADRTLGVVVLSYWDAWLMLYSFSLWKLLVAPVATTVLLRWLGISLDGEGWATYILAGYSADSIGDLALARLKTLSDKATGGIAAKLG